MKDLQYEQAIEIYHSMEPSIKIIEKHSVDIEKLYWLVQLEPQIMFEQGMYYKASLAYERIGLKVKQEFTPIRCPKGMLEQLHTANSYSLLRCYVKMRDFDAALPLSLQLLSVNPPSPDPHLSTRIIMAGLRVLLSVNRNQLGSIKVTPFVNKIIQESRDCIDPLFRVELVHFLGLHVYLKLQRVQKAMRCFDDPKAVKMIQKENLSKRQSFFVAHTTKKTNPGLPQVVESV